MFSIQHDAIKGTTAGAPGTGSFTPNAAASGARAWSLVAQPWIGVVRYEDGSAWELSYGFWNGTAITRPAAGFIDSSTGSQLSLTSAATAALVASADEVETSIGASRLLTIQPTNGLWATFGDQATVTTNGAVNPPTLATTNLLTEQWSNTLTSATSVNVRAGVTHPNASILFSTASGRGGFDCEIRFGASQLPTGPRLFVGVTTTTLGANEPSANAGSFALFGKDSTDTNIQFLTKDGTTSGKTDTGIVLATGAPYFARIYAPPGGAKVYGLLIRWDTGDIWFGSRTANLPANGSFMKMECSGALNGTNTGTAFILWVLGMVCRSPV